MKKLINQLHATTDRFTICDFMLFKVVLLSIRVLVGFYLKNFSHGWIISHLDNGPDFIPHFIDSYDQLFSQKQTCRKIMAS